MAPPDEVSSRWTTTALLGLAALLLLSAIAAVGWFGAGDAVDFLLQRKQQPDLYVEGGSWNLHLPSTMLQLVLIPVVVWLARHLFGRPVAWSLRGLGMLAAALAAMVAVTWLVNDRPLAAVLAVWADPRYLAHSVRELATFPVTYYPIPLAVLLWRGGTDGRIPIRWRVPEAIAVAAAVFVVGVTYQVWVSLANDVGAMAQHPDFARDGELSISYLLASHYFEHVLDSIFFALLTLLLVATSVRHGPVEAPASRARAPLERR